MGKLHIPSAGSIGELWLMCECRWVTKDVLGKGEWGHWGSAPIAVGIGAGLLALVGV